eukprot:scaffold8705_cov140-Amphora_coffeaeformis.AAC.6
MKVFQGRAVRIRRGLLWRHKLGQGSHLGMNAKVGKKGNTVPGFGGECHDAMEGGFVHIVGKLRDLIAAVDDKHARTGCHG